MTMTMTMAPNRPAPQRPGDAQFVSLATELGVRFAARAAQHDRDNTFVEENFQLLRESGYTALAIPAELGGLGASLRQICYAQAELARYCGATALAVNMHIYSSLTNIYRWKNGAAEVEGLLRRVADEKLILMTSGGSDGVCPATTATRVAGGYRVTGRKIFCSQAPILSSTVGSEAWNSRDLKSRPH